MGKWIALLLAVIVACVVAGFLIDAIRVIAWAAVVVLVGVLAVQTFIKRKS
ncbi:hypothetical protein [Phenylobacterium sp.]|jgi:hypothetical protein|uniref:hypothetical protein n=1 Tax=Phenylobacterium sp. TaxID=1871053 RepID=UPI002F92928D